MSQDGIGGKDVAHAIDGELLDDRIVHRGDGVEFLVLRPLEGHRHSRRHAVEGIVVLVDEAAPQQILLLGRSIGVADVLGNLGQVELVDALPVRPDRHGGLPLDALAPPAAAEASAATAAAPAASPAATAGPTAGAVPPGALGGVLVRRLAGVGRLPLLLGVEHFEAVHGLALAGRGDVAAGLRLGRVDQLEGPVLLGVDLVLELGVGALPVAAEAAPIPLPLLVGMIGRGKVGSTAEAVGATEGGEGEAGELGRGTVGVGVVRLVPGGGSPRRGVLGNVGDGEAHGRRME
mmetsp:Transcript_6200/g.17332  ORF Transcript_6200/g.17332 Transcript_6200/m.17332 type:complete len:291 (+) Transcript_6200:2479-3351(+)